MSHISFNKILIEKSKTTKIKTVDFTNLLFGNVFTDHMFVCDFVNDKWQTPKILPYQPITFQPSAKVFHYGQAVFEGMKAYKDKDGKVFLFRPDQNFKRLNKSLARLAMPEISKHHFYNGLETLLNVDKDWIKPGLGNSLYIRPFIIATETTISASPSVMYKFMIICSPARSYYNEPVKVLFSEKYSRSANGGIGFVKAAGNYAAQFYPTNLALEKGYQQIIWTDASTHNYLEEAGTMNIFFRLDDKLLTAPTNDRILDGVTRKSVLTLAKDFGIESEVKDISVKEIKDAAINGNLKEIFGTGTAAVISPINVFEYKNTVFEITPVKNSYASLFKSSLLNIQHNIADDKYNWRYSVK